MVSIQRRVRRLVPAPLGRVDLAVFRLVARTHLPLADHVLPRLSRAANHSLLWMATAAALLASGGRRRRRAALRGLAALSATSTLTNLPAKLLAGRTRPDLAVVPHARRLARLPASTSFPSGHAASAAAFATGAVLEWPALRWPLSVVAGAVAFSRVYTGVHYPGDVLAGAAIGAGLALHSARVWPVAPRRPAAADDVSPAARPGSDGSGLTVVVNPASGPALAAGPEGRLRQGLPGARVVEVPDGGDLDAILADAAETSAALGMAGGDGSAGAAAAVLHASGKPLLVVPAGTHNHLATELGIADVDDAVAAVRGGRTIAVDVAEIDGRPFVNTASLGLYPAVVDARERREGRVGKWPSYLLALVETLRRARPLEIELDGEAMVVWSMFVGNCRYRTEGFTPTRRARLDEGVLDVRIVRADRPWARTRMLLATLAGRPRRAGVYERRVVEGLRVRCPGGPPRLAVDGETFDGPPQFAVRKLRPPLAVLVP